jgi:hypothetical protein
VETAEKQQKVIGVPFKKGVCPNPDGRPNGQRNYATIYREGLRRLAEAKNMTPEEIEELIEQTGLEKALGGDFKFFQDVRDRIHGKPKQGVELTGKDGGAIETKHSVEWM